MNRPEAIEKLIFNYLIYKGYVKIITNILPIKNYNKRTLNDEN